MFDGNTPTFLATREWTHFDDQEGCLLLPRKPKKLTRKFESIVTEISDILDLADKHRKEKPMPMHTTKGILKQLIYQLGRFYLDGSAEATLRDLLIQRINNRGGRILKSGNEFGGGNIFYLGCRAIPHNHAPIKGGELSKLSKQLYYAFLCDVPPKYLIGFIYQTGGTRVLAQRTEE